MKTGQIYVIVALILGGLLGFVGDRGWDRPSAPIESSQYEFDRPSWRDEIPRPVAKEPFVKP